MKISYDEKSASVMLTLSNGCSIVQFAHPQTNEPVMALNFEDVAKACVPTDEWISYLKLKGIEIGGVMCSATAADQNGLMAKLSQFQLFGEKFEPTVFYFENGSVLNLSKDNILDVVATWIEFRNSFFSP
jgi:hypothetical protein